MRTSFCVQRFRRFLKVIYWCGQFSGFDFVKIYFVLSLRIRFEMSEFFMKKERKQFYTAYLYIPTATTIPTNSGFKEVMNRIKFLYTNLRVVG